MGCGSSSVVAPADEKPGDTLAPADDEEDRDDLSTVVLPDTPVKPRKPIAFEIPLEGDPAPPPPHLARLRAPAPDLTLPDIVGKLAGAEARRMALLHQRAASAQRRTQKMMKSFQEVDRVDSENEVPEEPSKRPAAGFAVAGLGGGGMDQKHIS